jgi:hypothetical protein
MICFGSHIHLLCLLTMCSVILYIETYSVGCNLVKLIHLILMFNTILLFNFATFLYMLWCCDWSFYPGFPRLSRPPSPGVAVMSDATFHCIYYVYIHSSVSPESLSESRPTFITDRTA